MKVASHLSMLQPVVVGVTAVAILVVATAVTHLQEVDVGASMVADVGVSIPRRTSVPSAKCARRRARPLIGAGTVLMKTVAEERVATAALGAQGTNGN
jgi:hypothetical protein